MPNPVDFKRLPSLNALRAFDCAARHGSFTQAAQELCVTPGAVSHQVKLLEEQLGRALFERLPNQLVLTPAGKSYLPAVQAAFALLQQATLALLQPSERRLVVSTSPNFNACWLVPRLSRFTSADRQGGLQIEQSTTLVDVTQGSHAGGADVAIRWGQGPWAPLACTRLSDEFLVPVCAPNHAARWRQQAWHKVPLLHAKDTSDWASWLLRWGQATAEESVPSPSLLAQAGCVFNQEAAAIEAAAAGQGVALARSSLVVHALQEGRLTLFSSATLALQEAYWLVSAPQSAAIHPWQSAFLQWMQEEAERDRMWWRTALGINAATAPTDAGSA